MHGFAWKPPAKKTRKKTEGYTNDILAEKRKKRKLANTWNGSVKIG